MDDECDDYTDIAVHDEHYVLACVCTCVLVCDGDCMCINLL